MKIVYCIKKYKKIIAYFYLLEDADFFHSLLCLHSGLLSGFFDGIIVLGAFFGVHWVSMAQLSLSCAGLPRWHFGEINKRL